MKKFLNGKLIRLVSSCMDLKEETNLYRLSMYLVLFQDVLNGYVKHYFLFFGSIIEVVGYIGPYYRRECPNFRDLRQNWRNLRLITVIKLMLSNLKVKHSEYQLMKRTNLVFNEQMIVFISHYLIIHFMNFNCLMFCMLFNLFNLFDLSYYIIRLPILIESYEVQEANQLIIIKLLVIACFKVL